jgi:hypothetical protein
MLFSDLQRTLLKKALAVTCHFSTNIVKIREMFQPIGKKVFTFKREQYIFVLLKSSENSKAFGVK